MSQYFATPSPLYTAVGENNPALVKLHLQDAEQREAMDIYLLGTDSPMTLAARKNFIECGRALLNAGAKINSAIWENGIGELTLSQYARHYGNNDFAAMVDQYVLARERIEAASQCAGSLEKACFVNLRQGFFANPKQVFRHLGLEVDLAANTDSQGHSVLPPELHVKLGLD